MRIAFDTETYLFGPGNMAPKVVCLTARDGGEDYIWTAASGANLVQTWLQDPDVTLIGQNVAYDFACLIAKHGLDPALVFQVHEDGRVLDTEHLERLIQIARGRPPQSTSLKDLVKRYFDRDMDKDTWRLGYAELDGVPFSEWPQGALDYAMGDATDTLAVFEAQERKCLEWGIWDNILPELKRQTTYALAMHLMSVWGVTCDPERSKILDAIAAQGIDELTPALLEEGLLKQDRAGKISKTKKIIQARISAHFEGNPPMTKPSKTYPAGQVKTDDETVEKCKDQVLVNLSQRDKLGKYRSTYLSKMMVRLTHPRWWVLGAESGRSSCSNWNAQNLHRDGPIRNCVIAPAGKVLLACDYDSQEFRMFGQSLLRIVGHSTLAEKYQADPDFDPHTDFASGLETMSYAMGMNLKAQKDLAFTKLRQGCKIGNFGFMGGMGAATFVEYAAGFDHIITFTEAQARRDAWYAQWPEVKDYFAHIASITNYGGVMTHLYSGRIHAGVTYTACANGYPQGLASDASKYALFLVSRECYAVPDSPLYGCRPVLFIHDEIILEALEERAAAAAVRLEELMVQAQQLWTPDIPARATASLMRRWAKAAGDPVFNAAGTLIPYEDRIAA